MKDAAYYRWLDSPFTSVEQADLARIERKHQLVQRLSDQVAAVAGLLRAFYSAWPRRRWSIYKLDELAPKTSRRASGITFFLDPSRFDLTIGESEYWPALLEKKGRPSYLAQFEYNSDANNGFIARLEREKPLLSSSEQLIHYLNDRLAVFNQEHEQFLKAEAASRWPDEARYYRIVEGRNRRAGEFRQHITNELADLSELGIVPATPLDESLMAQSSTSSDSVLQFHLDARSSISGVIDLKAVAILHFFKFDGGHPITRAGRATEIAKIWGRKSGEKLSGYYGAIRKATGITGVEGKRLPKMVQDIEAILPLLEGTPKQKALKALNELQLKVE